MPYNLYDSSTGDGKQEQNAGTSVVTGTIINNCDQAGQGKLLVRIPSLDTEVWCSMTSPGGGPDTGIQFIHRVDDNVLVALDQNDAADAYILGGVWSTADRPPVSSPEAPTKRVIKSGLKGRKGHQIEMDDDRQSFTIESATGHTIKIDPNQIKVSNKGDSATISIDTNSGNITISGADIKISGTKSITLNAPTVDITGKTSLTVKSDGACTIGGKPVNIN